MKLIIDTDPGVDDALAIALAHALPEVELVALTTIFGNTFVNQSSRNARYLLDMLGADIPVAEGAQLPYGEITYEPSANVHGPEGFGAIPHIPEIGKNADESAAELLCRMTRENPGEITVCAIGPLTNIADALRLDPSFSQNVKNLVIMGGAFEVPGNITPHAEANIYHDAQAADEVFASGVPLVMVGLNATMQTLLTLDDFANMSETSPKIGGFIDEISQFYLGFYRSVGIMDGCPMHDSTAILACTNPERFTMKQSGLRSSLEKTTLGATVADQTRTAATITMGVDAAWAVDKAKAAIATLP